MVVVAPVTDRSHESPHARLFRRGFFIVLYGIVRYSTARYDEFSSTVYVQSFSMVVTGIVRAMWCGVLLMWCTKGKYNATQHSTRTAQYSNAALHTTVPRCVMWVSSTTCLVLLCSACQSEPATVSSNSSIEQDGTVQYASKN